MNWPYLARSAVLWLLAIFLFYRAQVFFVRLVGRLAAKLRSAALRNLARASALLFVLAMTGALILGYAATRLHITHSISAYVSIAGMWFVASVGSFIAVRVLETLAWSWRRFRMGESKAELPAAAPDALRPKRETAQLTRRDFFEKATILAGAIPFAGVAYGFAITRLHFTLRRLEISLYGLPSQLDGLTIAQLSDIHIGGFMTRESVRRAVEMAGETNPHLVVVTGDLITSGRDPIEAAVEEVAELRPPLGVWGCNGNHEVYAHAEALAADLFRKAGMRILRQENAQLAWRGGSINLLGVDYVRQRTLGGVLLPILPGMERLVRHDMPNILLSHNPNSFPRAAAMGIELSLAGHTHGGQVQVEILDQTLTPGRFLTPYVAGLYRRPLSVSMDVPDVPPASHSSFFSSALVAATAATTPAEPAGPQTRFSHIYVNRGIGTVGAPIRLGVPPEVTLITLRRP
jgi:predicted MPP superfamily phosphohydrolase